MLIYAGLKKIARGLSVNNSVEWLSLAGNMVYLPTFFPHCPQLLHPITLPYIPGI